MFGFGRFIVLIMGGICLVNDSLALWESLNDPLLLKRLKELNGTKNYDKVKKEDLMFSVNPDSVSPKSFSDIFVGPYVTVQSLLKKNRLRHKQTSMKSIESSSTSFSTTQTPTSSVANKSKFSLIHHNSQEMPTPTPIMLVTPLNSIITSLEQESRQQHMDVYQSKFDTIDKNFYTRRPAIRFLAEEHPTNSNKIWQNIHSPMNSNLTEYEYDDEYDDDDDTTITYNNKYNFQDSIKIYKTNESQVPFLLYVTPSNNQLIKEPVYSTESPQSVYVTPYMTMKRNSMIMPILKYQHVINTNYNKSKSNIDKLHSADQSSKINKIGKFVADTIQARHDIEPVTIKSIPSFSKFKNFAPIYSTNQIRFKPETTTYMRPPVIKQRSRINRVNKVVMKKKPRKQKYFKSTPKTKHQTTFGHIINPQHQRKNKVDKNEIVAASSSEKSYETFNNKNFSLYQLPTKNFDSSQIYNNGQSLTQMPNLHSSTTNYYHHDGSNQPTVSTVKTSTVKDHNVNLNIKVIIQNQNENLKKLSATEHYNSVYNAVSSSTTSSANKVTGTFLTSFIPNNYAADIHTSTVPSSHTYQTESTTSNAPTTLLYFNQPSYSTKIKKTQVTLNTYGSKMHKIPEYTKKYNIKSTTSTTTTTTITTTTTTITTTITTITTTTTFTTTTARKSTAASIAPVIYNTIIKVSATAKGQNGVSRQKIKYQKKPPLYYKNKHSYNQPSYKNPSSSHAKSHVYVHLGQDSLSDYSPIFVKENVPPLNNVNKEPLYLHARPLTNKVYSAATSYKKNHGKTQHVTEKYNKLYDSYDEYPSLYDEEYYDAENNNYYDVYDDDSSNVIPNNRFQTNSDILPELKPFVRPSNWNVKDFSHWNTIFSDSYRYLGNQKQKKFHSNILRQNRRPYYKSNKNIIEKRFDAKRHPTSFGELLPRSSRMAPGYSETREQHVQKIKPNKMFSDFKFKIGFEEWLAKAGIKMTSVQPLVEQTRAINTRF